MWRRGLGLLGGLLLVVGSALASCDDEGAEPVPVVSGGGGGGGDGGASVGGSRPCVPGELLAGRVQAVTPGMYALAPTALAG